MLISIIYSYFLPILIICGQHWPVGLLLIHQCLFYYYIYTNDPKIKWILLLPKFSIFFRKNYLKYESNDKNIYKNDNGNNSNDIYNDHGGKIYDYDNSRNKNDRNIYSSINSHDKKRQKYFILYYRWIILYFFNPCISIIIALLLGIHFSKFQKKSFLYSNSVHLVDLVDLDNLNEFYLQLFVCVKEIFH